MVQLKVGGCGLGDGHRGGPGVGQGRVAGLEAKAWLCPFPGACPLAGKTRAVKMCRVVLGASTVHALSGPSLGGSGWVTSPR